MASFNKFQDFVEQLATAYLGTVQTITVCSFSRP